MLLNACCVQTVDGRSKEDLSCDFSPKAWGIHVLRVTFVEEVLVFEHFLFVALHTSFLGLRLPI